MPSTAEQSQQAAQERADDADVNHFFSVGFPAARSSTRVVNTSVG